MKVVVRSSSLLFTLLSIIFHVPIQRAKRSANGNAAPEGDSDRAIDAAYRNDVSSSAATKERLA